MKHLLVATVLSAVFIGGGATPSYAQYAPDGIYLMTRMWISSFEMDVYYFGPGIAVNAPGYDIAAYGTSYAEEQNPGTVGDVSFTGGTMRIDWHDGDVTEADLEPSSGGCFNFDGGLFCPVEKFSSSTLSGVFHGGAAVGGGTSAFASSGQTLLFQEDGRYAMGSTTVVDSIAGGVDATAYSDQAEAGHYTISGNSIEFYPDGGQAWSTASFPYHDDALPGAFPNRIYFDGVMMSRQ